MQLNNMASFATLFVCNSIVYLQVFEFCFVAETGHDWISHPGAIIHGKVQPFQAKIFNIRTREEGPSRWFHWARTSGARSFSNSGRNSIMKHDIIALSDAQKLAEACCCDEKSKDKILSNENYKLIQYFLSNRLGIIEFLGSDNSTAWPVAEVAVILV